MGKYKNCLIVGRFQTFHKGHEIMIGRALMCAENVHIFIGSSQLQGTLRNPFSYEMRRNVIKAVYGDAVTIYPLEDLTHEDDISYEWGKYVLDKVITGIGDRPDLMVYGNDENRIGWFDKTDIIGIDTLVINREKTDISATRVRNEMKNDNKEIWKSLVNISIWDKYSEIREALLKADGYND
jgi:nicotinamide-nucleotide adenylyltransferase